MRAPVGPSHLLSLVLLAALAPPRPAMAQPPLAARVREAVGACGPGAGRVSVSVSGGVVTLTGVLPTLADRQCAAERAERVEGVRHVYPGALLVRPSRPMSDEEVRDAVHAALAGLADLESPALLPVSVAGGVVTLSGVVHSVGDLARIDTAVRLQEGVRELSNEIRVDPTEGLRRLEVELQDLVREERLNAKDIRVSRDGDVVVIDGVAHDVLARERLESLAERIAGGQSVRVRVRYLLRPPAAQPDRRDR